MVQMTQCDSVDVAQEHGAEMERLKQARITAEETLKQVHPHGIPEEKSEIGIE